MHNKTRTGPVREPWTNPTALEAGVLETFVDADARPQHCDACSAWLRFEYYGKHSFVVNAAKLARQWLCPRCYWRKAAAAKLRETIAS